MADEFWRIQAVAIIGMAVLLLSSFPPDGSIVVDTTEGHEDEEQERATA